MWFNILFKNSYKATSTFYLFNI